jgi:hypothetical protein
MAARCNHGQAGGAKASVQLEEEHALASLLVECAMLEVTTTLALAFRPIWAAATT